MLDRIEADFRRAAPRWPSPGPSRGAARGQPRVHFALLLQGRQTRITLMTWIMWLSITFSYYSFFVWIPGLLVESGMSMTKSFGYSLAIYCAQVPGYFSAAWFNEKIGRQATIASYMLLGGAGALGLALAKTDGQIMLAGIIMSS